MKIIAGLGNPGKKYENTRHNLGFLALDKIAEKLGCEIGKSKFESLICDVKTGDEKVILMKPATYMNESGRAVKQAADYYDVPVEDLLVIYDDFDIETGNVRIRPFGSAGTHNGMRSIINCLGTNKFPRIRLGTGRGDIEEIDLASFVLSGFSKEEKEAIDEAIDMAASAALCYIDSGIDLAMNRYNGRKKEKDDE